MYAVISLLLQSRKFWWCLLLTSSKLLHDVIMTSYCCQQYAEYLVRTLFVQQDSEYHAAHRTASTCNCCVMKRQTFLRPTRGLQTAQISIPWITRSGLSCSIVSVYTTHKSVVWMNWNGGSSMVRYWTIDFWRGYWRLTLIRRRHSFTPSWRRVLIIECNPRRDSEDNNRQATTSVKRCCTSRQRHQEVWSGTITTDAPGVTLAGHSRADPPVSACSARRHCTYQTAAFQSVKYSFTAASTLRCTSSTDRTSTSSQHLWSAGICCRWSDDV